MSRRRAFLLAAFLIVPPTLFVAVAILAGWFEPGWTHQTAGWVLATYGSWFAISYALIKSVEAVRSRTVRRRRRAAPPHAPKPLDEFVGRRAEVRRLARALKPGQRVSIAGVVGMGGIGKTELAKVVAGEVSGRFGDGVLWADCGKQSFASIPDLWAGYLDQQLAGQDEEAKSAAWRRIVGEKEALLVFDNVQPGQDIEPLIPRTGRCAALITTRDAGHPALTEAQPLSLAPFTPREARVLAEVVLGPDRARKQEADARHVFSLVGHLPLAVSVALHTARDSGCTLDSLRARLEESGALAVLGDEPAVQQSLRATFDSAWLNLPADLKEAFHALALFNGGPSFGTLAFADSVDLPAEEAGELLRRLSRCSLLTELGDARWALHSLLREYACSKGPVWDILHLRMAQHYLSVVQRADEMFDRGGPDVLRGLALFDREWPHIRAGQAWSARHADVDDEAAALCSRYPDAGAYCLGLRLYGRDRVLWLHAAAAAAIRRGDRQAELGHLGSLGYAYAALGDRNQAIEYLERATAISSEIGDGLDEGMQLSNLGSAYAFLGNAQRAVECFEPALAISRRMGDRRHEGICLGNLGSAYAYVGDAKRAIDCLEEAADIARETGDRRGEASHLGGLGLAHARLGDGVRALGYCEEALSMSRETGDRRGEGEHLAGMGCVYAATGDAQQAIEYGQQALAISREIGDRRQEGWRLGNLGEVCAAQGDAREAVDYLERALVIALETGDLRHQGRHLCNMGIAYAAVGDMRAAIGFLERAVEIACEISDRHQEGRHLGILGNAYFRLGSMWEAIDCYEQAVAIARQLGDRRDEANLLANLGGAYADVGNAQKARDFWTRALVLYEAIDDPRALELRGWLS